MKLSDIRKVAVKTNVRIRFHLPNGMECVLDEHGIARIPGLKSIPDFNLEEQFAGVERFLLEPVLQARAKAPAVVRKLSRAELAALAAPQSALAGHAAEHEDE